jgi:FkbM family methyltransferase
MCVEGNEKIIPFLKKNTAQIKNLDIYYDFRFCTDATENNQFSVEMKDGTAHLVTSLNSEVKAASLDTMITEQPFFKKTNILKIDTDGFEITVLNGAKRLLKEQQPVIYFEYTPDAYIENGQDPYSLFSILVPYGYSKALFYTNFGDVLGIFDMKDAGKMRELVSRIDNKKICYYDILAIPDIKYNDYSQIFESEIQRKVISRGL